MKKTVDIPPFFRFWLCGRLGAAAVVVAATVQFSVMGGCCHSSHKEYEQMQNYCPTG
jgi:hypothetical protein